MDDKKLAEVLEVFLTVQVSKELPRQGFLYSGFKINEADSVAAHSYNVAMFAYIMATELKKSGWNINPDKTLKIAMMHDIGESITGDIGTYAKELARDRFDKVEKDAVKLLIRNLSAKEKLMKYFREYQKLSSIEAQVVKFVDTLDAFVQAFNTPSANMDDVKSSVAYISKKKIKNPKLFALFNIATRLIDERKVTLYKGHVMGNTETQEKL
jgi:putative hydrolases of HD superfamily